VKRSPLIRRTRLKPVSDKRAARLEADRGQVEREGGAFRAAIKGKVCVICGRSERESYAATGFGHQAHHGLSQQLLRRLGLQELLWAPQLAVCVCVSCHAAHTSRKARIARERLPEPLTAFCREHGLERWLELEYPA
jgi:predicted HNH restriction endonuclease